MTDSPGAGESATGVYTRAAGEAAADLHPKVRERYGDGPGTGVVCRARGEMDITNRTFALPALYAMSARNLLFPETGTSVPFTATSAEYRTASGYQVLGMRREFHFPETVRRFDSRTLWDDDGGRLLDFLGTGGLLVSELHPRVDGGALEIASGRQWLRLGDRYLRLPGPLAVDVTVRDYYDDGEDQYHVETELRSGVVGRILEYDGVFTQERSREDAIPDSLRPSYELTELPPG